MASYKPGDTYNGTIKTYATGGASTDADSLPTAKLRRNGAIDNAVALTVTHDTSSGVSPGTYPATCTIPLAYSAGDRVEIEPTATIGGVTASWVLGEFVLDGARIADLLATFGLVFTVADSSPLATTFIVTGPPSDVAVNAYMGKSAVVLIGDATANPNAVGQSAPITASSAVIANTSPPQVRLTLGSGLSAPPGNGAKIWVL